MCLKQVHREGGCVRPAPGGQEVGGARAVMYILLKCHRDSFFPRRRASPASPGPLGTDASFVRAHYSFMGLRNGTFSRPFSGITNVS